MSKSTKNFLSDQSYCDLIEMCIKHHDKFGANTFFADIMISEHVEETCINGMNSTRAEIFPNSMGEECPPDLMFAEFCEDGEDGDYDE